jgi:hypothetical protein
MAIVVTAPPLLTLLKVALPPRRKIPPLQVVLLVTRIVGLESIWVSVPPLFFVLAVKA